MGASGGIVMNTASNVQASQEAGNFKTRWPTLSLSFKTLPH